MQALTNQLRIKVFQVVGRLPMTRSSSEPAIKNFTWSQLKDQLG